MKKLPSLVLGCCAAALSYLVAGGVLAQTETPAPATEAFPIVSRFELPRDYGYFLGDEIPLTLIVETANGVVLDLVNLPQKGEKHGLFEVRDMRLMSTTTPGRKIYRAQYTLQYFGAAPLSTPFEPLEILYALAADRQTATNTYHYKSLRTQPMLINVSRISPLRPVPAMDIKGPLADSRPALIWVSVTLGTLLVLIAAGGWGRQFYRWRQQHADNQTTPPSPAAQTLATLRQEGMGFRAVEAVSAPSPERLSEIIRQHLLDVWSLSARTCTQAELVTHLQDKPLGKELLHILEHCDLLMYQAPADAQDDLRHLWWEATVAFEKLQEVPRS